MPELPLEVWSSITAVFQLQPLRLGDYDPDTSFLSNRACLRNLCLTSNKLAAAARPRLYESIILFAAHDDDKSGPESLVQLLLSLVSYPSLRRHVRHLSCALSLWPTDREGNKNHREAVLQSWHAVRDAVFEHLPPAGKRLFVQATLLEPSDQAPAPESWPYARHVEAGRALDVQRWNGDSQTPQKLLAVLLCFTPRLQTLLLRGSCHADIPIRPFSELLEYFLRQTNNSGNQDPVLPLLSTIRVQPDQGAMLASGTGVHLCQDFLAHLPNLRRLDQWKVSWVRGGINSPRAPCPKWANGLEDIHVALAAPLEDITGFVEQTHALRTLRVDRIVDRIVDPAVQAFSPSLEDFNQALIHRAGTLKRLRLTGMPRDFRTRASSLWCLPQLHHVEHLEIEHSQLVRRRAPAGATSVPDLLPPSLKKLKLLFLQGCDHHFESFLLTFPLDLQFARGQGRLKRLQKVHLEVFSATNADGPKWRAHIDARLVTVLEQGCVCTYTLNRYCRMSNDVEPWALDDFW